MYQGNRRVGGRWREPVLEPAAVVSLHSPIGELFVAATARGVVASGFEEQPFLEELTNTGYEAVLMGANPEATTLAESAREALIQYFDGRRLAFDLPVALKHHTEFGRGVLEEVARRVPFGTTATYGEVGERAGRLRAARAVGNIMAACPFSVVVPCHRIVHAGWSPRQRPSRDVSYSTRKDWLLLFEREVLGNGAPTRK